MGRKLLSILLTTATVNALKFDLSSAKVKCFSEDIPDNTLVLGKYNVEYLKPKENPFDVTNPSEKVLFQRDNITTGTFVFTSTVAGDYIVCFHNMGHPNDPHASRVGLDLKHGVDAQDYSKVMRAEHLTPLQKRREEYMRDLTEQTCERVAFFAIFTMMVLVSTSAAQTLYLRSYFRLKKII